MCDRHESTEPWRRKARRAESLVGAQKSTEGVVFLGVSVRLRCAAPVARSDVSQIIARFTAARAVVQTYGPGACTRVRNARVDGPIPRLGRTAVELVLVRRPLPLAEQGHREDVRVSS